MNAVRGDDNSVIDRIALNNVIASEIGGFGLLMLASIQDDLSADAVATVGLRATVSHLPVEAELDVVRNAVTRDKEPQPLARK